MNAKTAAAVAALAGLASATLGQTGFTNWETPHVSPITLTPSGQTLLAVNTADGRLEVFSLASGSPVRTQSIGVGVDPVSVRARTESEVWVVNKISDSISVVDLATGRVKQTILTGDEPEDVVFANGRAFVTLGQLNQVAVFNLSNLASVPTVLSIQGEEPRALAVSPDGTRVYVAIFESGNATGVVRVQDVNNTAGPYAGQNPPPNSGNVFSPQRTAGLGVPPRVSQIVRRNAAGNWMDDNNRNWSQFVTWNVLDNDVAMIDTSTLSVSYAQGLMTTVAGIGVAPDGRVEVVGTEAKNETRFEPNVKSVFIRSEIASFAPATPGVKVIADLNPHLNYSVRSIPQAQRDLSVGDPRGIAIHPTSGSVYVSGMGSNNVVVTNTSGTRLAQINVGEGPTGLALNASGSVLYVLNKFEGSISVIDTGTNTEVTRVPFFDPTPDTIKTGRPFLYNTHMTSGLGQASCASCHIDAKTDFLAWDLGNPAGTVKFFDQTCQTPTCRNWDPMKGPMVTQSLQGIVGNEPLHWRGDRENVAAFAPAFTDLQGMDAAPTAAQMDQLTQFIQTIQYQPNPIRQLDGTVPTSIATSDGGTGNPVTGAVSFRTVPVLPGGATCQSCHALPNGSNGHVDDPPGKPQPLKIAQLRGLYEKNGWSRTSQSNTKLTGFDHDSDFDTLSALLNGSGFNFAPGAQGTTQKRDIEAFMLTMQNDTHAGVGQQLTIAGTPAGATLTRLNTFLSLAASGQCGLVVRGRVNGENRSYYYFGSGQMQSDRVAEIINETALRALAAPGSELTYTLVSQGTQRRIGVDRDGDGYFDRDELDAGSDPADASSVPCNPDMNNDGVADQGDVDALINAIASGTPLPGGADPDFNHDGVADQGDVDALIARIAGSPCP